MPEGDVVWRTAQRLNLALAGDPLRTSDLRWPSLATVDLTGRTVLEVVSAGKHIMTRLSASPDLPPDPPLTLHSHLRMEGSWSLHRSNAGSPVRGGSGVRAILATDRWTAVGHKLGMLDLVPTDREHQLVGHLGPDLLGPDWDADRVTTTILADGTRAPAARPVGELLLDQRVLAGVGTFYMSEALFLRGITPWTPSADLDRPAVAALVDLVHRLIHANRDRAVQVTTGDTRPGRSNWVHARSGRPCRRCGSGVRVAMIGAAPNDRTAFYCPHCQRGPHPTDDGRPQAPLGAGGRPSRRGRNDRLP